MALRLLSHPAMKRREFETEALPHLSALYAVAVRYTRDPVTAEDLVQETYLRAYAAWSSFVPGSNCRAWLLRILTNGFINGYRQRRTHRQFALRSEDEQVGAFYDEQPGPERRVEESLGDEVTRALARSQRTTAWWSSWPTCRR